MTLSSLSFVVFLDPYQGSNGVCLLSKYVVLLVRGIVALHSLSPYSNKVLISGAHRWETANTYLQDILDTHIVSAWSSLENRVRQGSGHLPLFISSYPFSLFLEHSSPKII